MTWALLMLAMSLAGNLLSWNVIQELQRTLTNYREKDDAAFDAAYRALCEKELS